MSAQNGTRRPHLLVVDSDCEARTHLIRYLEQADFHVTAVTDGLAMSRALDKIQADLIILDVLLERGNGFNVCRQLRERSQIPLIMVSEEAAEVDRIVGLELGADAYLTKPVNLYELSVRVRTILRRRSIQPQVLHSDEIRAFSFGGWVLDNVTRTLTDPTGCELHLTGAEYQLLALLLRSENRIVSRTQILECLCARQPKRYDRCVDVRVSRLRQILQDDARAPRIIKTVYGQGYVVAVNVQLS